MSTTEANVGLSLKTFISFLDASIALSIPLCSPLLRSLLSRCAPSTATSPMLPLPDRKRSVSDPHPTVRLGMYIMCMIHEYVYIGVLPWKGTNIMNVNMHMNMHMFYIPNGMQGQPKAEA